MPARMPESPLYTELLGIHDGIMKAMVAQKQEVKWALSPQEHIKKKLRVYVYSDHYNQPHSKEFDSRGLMLLYSPMLILLSPLCV